MSDREARIMALLSTDNPKSRQHRENPMTDRASLTLSPTFGPGLWLGDRLVARIVATVEDSRVTPDEPEPRWKRDAMTFVNAVNARAAPPAPAGDERTDPGVDWPAVERLVDAAIRRAEITASRGAEILGLRLTTWRERARELATEATPPAPAGVSTGDERLQWARRAVEALPTWDKRTVPGGLHVNRAAVLAILRAALNETPR